MQQNEKLNTQWQSVLRLLDDRENMLTKTDGRIAQHTKVKGPDIYIPPLTGKQEQQKFTM